MSNQYEQNAYANKQVEMRKSRKHVPHVWTKCQLRSKILLVDPVFFMCHIYWWRNEQISILYTETNVFWFPKIVRRTMITWVICWKLASWLLDMLTAILFFRDRVSQVCYVLLRTFAISKSFETSIGCFFHDERLLLWKFAICKSCNYWTFEVVELENNCLIDC